jgi:DNA-binding FadR family transcriptional regulator
MAKMASRTTLNKQTMADQLAEEIKQLILSSEWESGEALPTEPEISEQFGVSRAVVREATRILIALGLVEAQHGRGVFVTTPKNDAFGDALLLALQRSQATVWDVEQFDQYILPDVLAMAAEQGTDQDIQELERIQAIHLDAIAEYHKKWWKKEPPPGTYDSISQLYQEFTEKLFATTHNQLMMQLARPLLRLRNYRTWDIDDQITPEDFIKFEQGYFNLLLSAVKSRDPEEARQIARQTLNLPSEAIEAMKNTPVGEVPVIRMKIDKQRLDSFFNNQQ